MLEGLRLVESVAAGRHWTNVGPLAALACWVAQQAVAALLVPAFVVPVRIGQFQKTSRQHSEAECSQR